LTSVVIPFILVTVITKSYKVIVPKHRSDAIQLEGSAHIPPGPPVEADTGKSKGENMESKALKSVTKSILMVLLGFILLLAFAANAAESGAPPSGAGPAEVKEGSAPALNGVILSITFLGNKKFTSEQLQKVIDGTELKIGGGVGPSNIAPAMKALVDFYRKNGANLSASPNIIEDPKGIVFVQFIIDENGTKGDIGGLVSSGGPHIFYDK